ncbi:MAG: thioredoxin-disulfide reductase [Candidatus Nanoarchaeia archaeon]|nr:thioredoxin-disulfide reductase [Candidatus Nanoarchaeia archaeon]
MPKKEIYDVIIIGSGIAAHSAAVYLSRAALKPLIIGAPEPDQLSLTTVVENYPGFPNGIMGPELIENCKKQAQKFGAEYKTAWVTSFKKSGKNYEVGTDKERFVTRTVIISTGASARWLGVKGEDKYKGKGISTCAVCDAALFRDKEVIVIGGGDSAMEETLALYKFAKKITIIHRRDSFRASKIMQARVLKLNDKIKIIWDSEIVEITGNKFVEGAKIKNIKTNKKSEIKCQGVFLAIGHTPNTKIFEKLIKLDKLGYVVTDKRINTNLPGVFAAGDVQDFIYKQAVTSAGTGCMAALEAEKYIENLKAIGEY